MTQKFFRTILVLLAAGCVAAPPGTGIAKPRRGHSASQSQPASTYTVKRGDSLAKIATRLKVDVDTLAKLNGLKRPYRLDPGQVLKTGRGASAKSEARSESSARRSGAAVTYTVKRGDTLYGIAKRFGVSAEAIRAENGLSKRASLVAGRKLKIPGEGVAADNTFDEPLVETKGRRRTTEVVEAGRVVEVAGERRSYRVRRGDTAAEVADRLGVSLAELARINRLKKPYHLRRGQVLRGAPTSGKAYVVAQGDTVAEIARRFGVTERALRAANGLRRGASVSPGRKLRLPAGARERGPSVQIQRETPSDYAPRVPRYEPPTRAEPQAELPNGPQPYSGRPQPPRRPAVPPANGGIFAGPTATPQLSDAELSQRGRGLFVWPVRGEVINGFGPKGGGQRNDGLNIRAAAGEPVHAAAAGTVVYSGDQVPGFGNLVLIQHSDGWVTAYGYLSRTSVRMQQKVIQGQEIGQVGATGGASEPQLHFEVRFRPSPSDPAKPLDPALVLPQ